MDILKNFSKNLMIMLKEQGLTKNQFSKMIGVSSSCVSKWILCQREPTLTNIYKICKVLNCTFEELIS